MTKKIVFGIWMAFLLLAGIFCVNFVCSLSDVSREDAAAADCRFKSSLTGETVREDESLTMPEAISGKLSAYMKTTIRTVNSASRIPTVREHVRRRSSQLLWFAAVFCTILKRLHCSSLSAMLLICLIFVNYFQIQTDTLYRGDGKKRYASIC